MRLKVFSGPHIGEDRLLVDVVGPEAARRDVEIVRGWQEKFDFSIVEGKRLSDRLTWQKSPKCYLTKHPDCATESLWVFHFLRWRLYSPLIYLFPSFVHTDVNSNRDTRWSHVSYRWKAVRGVRYALQINLINNSEYIYMYRN